MGGRSLKDHALFRSQCYIDAVWTNADNGQSFEVINPANGNPIGSVPNMGETEAKRAIYAAYRAFPGWSQLTAKDRCDVLRRWAQLMLQHQEDLALLVTTEQGKPLSEAKAEVAYAASFIEYFAEEAKRVYGDTIPQPQRDKRIVVLKQPIGVVACITPWNLPMAMVTRKAGPALAAGCTMVLKPAEQTPYSALALAELADRAGMPKGIFNVITGEPSVIGRELTSNPVVRKISFTGSTEVGRLLMAQSAPTIKKLSLELGGNSPFIVFDDADVDAAVAGAMACKYRNAGQTCISANRFLVQDKVYDEFADKFVEQVKQLRVGDGTQPNVDQGPLIDEQGLKKVVAHVDDAIAKGAKALLGGKRHMLGGTYFEPTILRDANSKMILAREETFGPVAPLFRFHSEEQAVQIANDSEYGLAAYFYGRDIGRVWRVAEALEFGIVGINTGTISTETAPFGGVKQSGIGREGSKYGLDEYLEIKYLCMGGL